MSPSLSHEFTSNEYCSDNEDSREDEAEGKDENEAEKLEEDNAGSS